MPQFRELMNLLFVRIYPVNLNTTSSIRDVESVIDFEGQKFRAHLLSAVAY
jgi:hypothetical protein